jgi:hypothetical protein
MAAGGINSNFRKILFCTRTSNIILSVPSPTDSYRTVTRALWTRGNKIPDIIRRKEKGSIHCYARESVDIGISNSFLIAGVFIFFFSLSLYQPIQTKNNNGKSSSGAGYREATLSRVGSGCQERLHETHQ